MKLVIAILLVFSTIPLPAQAEYPKCEQFRPLVERYFYPRDVEIALQVMYAESTCRPTVESGKSHHNCCKGLFQYDLRYAWAEATKKWHEPPSWWHWRNPRASILAAFWTDDWNHWSVCKNSRTARYIRKNLNPDFYGWIDCGL